MALDVTLSCDCCLQVQEEIWIGGALVVQTLSYLLRRGLELRQGHAQRGDAKSVTRGELRRLPLFLRERWVSSRRLASGCFMGNEPDGVGERSFFVVAVGLRVRQVRARVLGDCRSSVGLVVMQSGSLSPVTHGLA